MDDQLYKTWGRDKKQYYRKIGDGPVAHVQNFQTGLKKAEGELLSQAARHTKSVNQRMAKMDKHNRDHVRFMLSKANDINGPLRQAAKDVRLGHGRMNKGFKE